MIKGINRRVVIMKNTGSECFDEAYFLIKENNFPRGKSPIEEARRIVREMELPKKKSILSASDCLLLLIGCAVGVAICLLTGI